MTTANIQNDENTARGQAAAQLRSVCDMVAALEVDYDRLEELRAEARDFTDDAQEDYEKGREEWQRYAEAPAGSSYEYDVGRELAELEDAAGDCEDQDDARQCIEEDALSVEIRSDWHSPHNDSEASEYRIVLCTGGPHVEIVGDLNQHCEPTRARLIYVDWGTGRQEYITDSDEQAALIAYAACFYYGEG